MQLFEFSFHQWAEALIRLLITLFVKISMLNVIENEIFVVKHTCNTANLHKNMAFSGKNDGRTKLGFFRISHELIFVDF